MSVISERFADELEEKGMRSAYVSAQTRTKLANQIRAIRSQRGWSQGDFAKELGKPQSNVSRLESRDYGNFTLATLFELASAFDCGLVVEFTPYQDFLLRTADLSPAALQVPSFSRAALEPLCHDPVPTQSDVDWLIDENVFAGVNTFSLLTTNNNDISLWLGAHGNNWPSQWDTYMMLIREFLSKQQFYQQNTNDGDPNQDMSVTEYPPSPRRRRPRPVQPLGTGA